MLEVHACSFDLSLRAEAFVAVTYLLPLLAKADRPEEQKQI